MSRKIARSVGRRIEEEMYGLFVEDVVSHYYSGRPNVSPLIFWWFAGVLLASIPAELYTRLTGVESVPASHPIGMLITVAMIGGAIILAIVHIGLWSHAKYLKYSSN